MYLILLKHAFGLPSRILDLDQTGLTPNTHRRRRRDSTVELSRVGGHGGVYWALVDSILFVLVSLVGLYISLNSCIVS